MTIVAKLYQYTLLYQDGTTDKLPPCPKKTFHELYRLLGCDMIEIIPSDYYNKMGWGKCTVYGDEEARFNSDNHMNPHFHVLAPGFDIVGNCIKEEVYHEA